MGSGIDGCFEPEKSFEVVRQETIKRSQKFKEGIFSVNPGIQTAEWALNYISAAFYQRGLSGKRGKGEKYVKKVIDFSFELNVAYGI
jgi:hypothetical protein